MMGADHQNQRGYWEPRKSIYLNRKILERHGSTWWKPGILDVDAFDSEERRAALASIGAYVDELPVVPLVVIKDPHIVPLADLWFDAVRQAGRSVATVITVRHPNEVSDSLRAATPVAPEHASVLWLKASLLAERNSRGVPRVFVEYASLLEDWRRETKRIAASLDVELSCSDDAAVDGFLTSDLRHQRWSGRITERFGADWISSVYDEMSAAAHDQPVNLARLDAIFEQYRASERDFRVVFEADRDYSGRAVSRILTPAVVKWIMGYRAMVHRNKGTWA